MLTCLECPCLCSHALLVHAFYSQEDFFESIDAIDISRDPRGSSIPNSGKIGEKADDGGFGGGKEEEGESAYGSKETERLLDQARRQMVEKGQSNLLQVLSKASQYIKMQPFSPTFLNI